MKGWLDFSGAPALVIPAHVVPLWRGITDPETGVAADPNFESPRTDYDRVCVATFGADSCLSMPLGKTTMLVIGLEGDSVLWDAEEQIVAENTEPPSLGALERATWSPVMRWRSERAEHLLMNAAADGAALRDDEWMPIRLPVGELVVEYAMIEDGEYSVPCHRFRSASD